MIILLNYPTSRDNFQKTNRTFDGQFEEWRLLKLVGERVANCENCVRKTQLYILGHFVRIELLTNVRLLVKVDFKLEYCQRARPELVILSPFKEKD